MRLWKTHGSATREWRLTNHRGRQIAALIFTNFVHKRGVGIVVGRASLWLNWRHS